MLMKELGIKPGPMVGQLLESIRENQAAGKIENREQAISFAREELSGVQRLAADSSDSKPSDAKVKR
jgi:hypothetical protein